ncbi:MAG: LysM peptidoglycan-binding domain-containing protein [Elusimicrobiota bacterium]
MKRFFVFYFLTFSLSHFLTPLHSQQKPKTYNVWVWQENGDCLWKIAEKFYGDGRKWKIIYEANKDEIKDPRKIYPKQKLIIP